MPASGLALAASALRVASLNLCTDEYLLLLARPAAVVSVSHLSHDPQESTLWRAARRFPANDGTVEGAIRFRPTMLLTMGGGGRDTVGLGRRLGIRVLDLPYPATIEDVRRQTAQVATALGESGRAKPILARLDALRAGIPAKADDAAFISGGGLSLTPDALGAQWMRLAGFRQRPLATGRLTLEELVTHPPKWLIRSNYRSTDFDRGQAWLHHPLVRGMAGRTIQTDGRRWTCGGLPMIAEIERLRAVRR